MSEADRDELVELTSVQGEMEGKILQGILDNEGIESMIKGDIVQSVHPITVDGLGEVKIYVRREDLAKARVVLEEYLEEGKNQ